MEGRRRYKGDNYNQGVSRTNYRKPPLGNWQPTVPAWEKKFCTLVGKVPWRKILDAEKLRPYHDNVIKWDDSAGEEAFHNAKSRFYAEIHGLTCEIPIPDPNLYIDDIDWDCRIDPEIVLDLEQEPADPDTYRSHESVVIFGDTLLLEQGFLTTGWGECDELNKAPDLSNVNNDSAWENLGNNSWGWYDNNGTPMVGHGWGDGWGNGGWGGGGWNNSWGWYDQYGNNYTPEYVQEQDPNGIHGTWYIDNRNREGTGSYFSGHETSRFHGNGYQTNQMKRNVKSASRKVNFVSQQPMRGKRTGSNGNWTSSCAPGNHQASGKAGTQWRSMEKPVS